MWEGEFALVHFTGLHARERTGTDVLGNAASFHTFLRNATSDFLSYFVGGGRGAFISNVTVCPRAPGPSGALLAVSGCPRAPSSA